MNERFNGRCFSHAMLHALRAFLVPSSSTYSLFSGRGENVKGVVSMHNGCDNFSLFSENLRDRVFNSHFSLFQE